jgi:periplasmic divalent cation tolerance protein
MRVALCTCPPAEAERIARALVQAGAACVNVLPGVKSVYAWKGAVCEDAEALLVVKFALEKAEVVREAMQASHPYELPEWVVFAPDAALTSEKYRAWVRGEAT